MIHAVKYNFLAVFLDDVAEVFMSNSTIEIQESEVPVNVCVSLNLPPGGTEVNITVALAIISNSGNGIDAGNSYS